MLNFFKKKTYTKTFNDPPTTAVFTTRFVIEDNKTITYVTHEFEDGAWQFFSEDKFENFEDVAKVVGLQQIIDRDPSVLDIADLPRGFIATRKSRQDKWSISRY